MSNKTIKVRITNEELFALGFERVIYNGKEYVDKSPFILGFYLPTFTSLSSIGCEES